MRVRSGVSGLRSLTDIHERMLRGIMRVIVITFALPGRIIPMSV
jgi:hypothetical protein